MEPLAHIISSASRRPLRRRVAATGLLLAVVAATLTACSGGGSAGPPTSSRSTTSSAPPTTTTTTTTTTSPASSTTTTAPAPTSTAPATTAPTTTVAPAYPPLPAGLGGTEWNVIPTSSRVAALTFDAGANADGVARILATLERDHVRATFFLTGNFVEQYPAEARAIVAAGMRVGAHSISHPYFTELTDFEIRQQVLGARDEIRAVTGADPWPWFRFPYFDRDSRTIAVVNSVGFVPIGWTVDTLGWEGTTAGITVSSIVQRVLDYLRPGAIIVMHCGSNPEDHTTLDADALPSVISALRARGYSFVTMDALLG